MKLTIINYSTVNTWHKIGQQKLRESLARENVDLLFTFGTPTSLTAYEEKIKAIKDAADLGFKYLLWLDSSITLIEGKTLETIFNYIKEKGVYLYPSGWLSGQTANLKALEFYGTNTNEQMQVNEVASNVVGINLESKIGKAFFDSWVSSLNSEANLGIKWPSEAEAIKENPDSRFLFSRLDQTSATLSAWKCGAPIDMDSLFVFRQNETTQKETSILRLKGL